MRSDGKKVTKVSPMYLIAPYFMTSRNDALNMINISAPYDNVHNYVLEQRKKGIKISHMAVVLAAYVRVVSQFRCLNRFVVNKKIFAHKELQASMVVLRPGDGNETMGKIKFDLADTIFDVNERIEKYIEENASADSNNDLDKILNIFLKIPFVLRFAMWLIRQLDNVGLLPKAIIKASPFHETMVFTNLASIKTNYIYHHIYNFGTCNVVLAMGNTVEKAKTVKGEIKMVKEIPFGMVMDERIADGHYFAQAFAEFKKYMSDPSLLETPPETLDVDYEFPTLSSRFPTKAQIKAEKKAAKKAARESKKSK